YQAIEGISPSACLERQQGLCSEPIDADGVAAGKRNASKRCSEQRGECKLGCGGSFAAKGHGVDGVQDQEQRAIRFGLELTHHQFGVPHQGMPVEPTQIIAWDIVAMPAELDARSFARTPVAAGPDPFSDRACLEPQGDKASPIDTALDGYTQGGAPMKLMTRPASTPTSSASTPRPIMGALGLCLLESPDNFTDP